MKIRNSKKTWRNGLGLGQIMATLLVVLPTMAFSVTFLIAYWNVMQVDYKLKLIANMAADFYNGQEDTTTVDDTSLVTSVSRLCPQGRTIIMGTSTYTGAAGEISIIVEYTTPATDAYLSNKKISTRMQTYSYHDQNMSVTLTCPNQ